MRTGAWPSERLKHVADVAYSSVDKRSVDGEVPVRLCNYTDVYYQDEITSDLSFMEATATPDQVRRFGLREGDVLITKDSESAEDIGVPAFVAETLADVVCGYHLAVLRPRRDRVEPRFLYWSMLSTAAREQMSVSASGVTRFGMRFDDVANLSLPIPEPERQRAIVRYLDRETARIDGVVTSKSRLTALLRERRQAIADRATVPTFAAGSDRWPLVPLRKLAAADGLFTDGDWIETPYIQSDGIRLIQTGNIGVGVFKEKGFRYISDATFRELRCTEVLPGDVLISRLADPVGRACLAPALGVRMVTAVDVCILRPNNAIDRRFLVAYLSSSAYLSFLDAMARGGTRERVSRDQLGQVPVPVPPLGEQKRIADDLERQSRVLDELEKRLNHQAAILREHRQALISAAVSGERGALEEAAR